MKFFSVAMMAAVTAALSIDEPAWCHRDSDCRQNGDNGARCIGAPGNCACSLGFGARKVGDVSVPLCFRNSRSLSLTANFKKQATTCYPEEVFSPNNKRIVLEWLRTIVNASSVPQSAVWTCYNNYPQVNVVLNHEGGHETYKWGQQVLNPTVDFNPSENAAKLTALLGTKAVIVSQIWDEHKIYDCVYPLNNHAAVRNEFKMHLAASGTIYDTNGDYDISATEVNATRVVGSSSWKAAWKFLVDNDVNKDGVLTYREFAFNKYIEQEKPTAAVLAKWSVNEDVAGGHITEASFVFNDHCAIKSCATNYFKRHLHAVVVGPPAPAPARAAAALAVVQERSKCTVVTNRGLPETNRCFADNDCSWEERQTACNRATGSCTFPPAKKAAPPMSVEWCLNNKECAAYGDAEAVCVTNLAGPNACRCSNGFSYISRYLPVCANAATRPSTMDFGFTVLLEAEAINCNTTSGNATVPAVRTLVEKALKAEAVSRVVMSCDDVKEQLTFLGKVTLKTAEAEAISRADTSDYLVEFLLAELAQHLPNVRNLTFSRDTAAPTPAPGPTLTVVVPERDAEVLQASNPYESLAGFRPEGFVLGRALECSRVGATVSRLDSNGACQAIECGSNYTAVQVHNIRECHVVVTPVVVAEDDDDLSTGSILLITLLTVGIVLLCVIVICVVLRSKQAAAYEAEQAAKNEPTNDEPVATNEPTNNEPAEV